MVLLTVFFFVLFTRDAVSVWVDLAWYNVSAPFTELSGTITRYMFAELVSLIGHFMWIFAARLPSRKRLVAAW